MLGEDTHTHHTRDDNTRLRSSFKPEQNNSNTLDFESFSWKLLRNGLLYIYPRLGTAGRCTHFQRAQSLTKVKPNQMQQIAEAAAVETTINLVSCAVIWSIRGSSRFTFCSLLFPVLFPPFISPLHSPLKVNYL